MITDKQIRAANETTRNAFEVVKRIYDLASVTLEIITEDLGEQLGLKKSFWNWNSGDSGFLQRYGQLSVSERNILKRYLYSTFTGTKSRNLPDTVVPFTLISIATRKFSQDPAIMWGVLKDINWQGQKSESEPFLYEISEKRKVAPLDVIGRNIMNKKGSAKVDFEQKSLFDINNDTIGDISKEMVDWFSEKLSEYLYREENGVTTSVNKI